MAIKFGGVFMPTSMSKRAESYIFNPGETPVRNGMGDVQMAGGATVIWKWSVLDLTEYTWLITSLLLNLPSRRLTNADGTTVLYNDVWQEQVFNNCIILRPVHSGYTGILYREVILTIDGIS